MIYAFMPTCFLITNNSYRVVISANSHVSARTAVRRNDWRSDDDQATVPDYKVVSPKRKL